MKNVNQDNKQRIASNYFFNLAYQIFCIVIPLITTPYLARILTSSGVGQFSYATSISSYFVLFAMLGFNIYAQREIAAIHEDKKKQSLLFWEIVIAKIITSAIAISIYLGLVFFNVFGIDYKLFLLILIINVSSSFFDITFFFQGKEKFKIIAIRNSIFRIISLVLVFVFVKRESDLWIYFLCYSIPTLIAAVSLWLHLPKMLCKVSIKHLNIKRHFLPSIKLFVPTLAISVYTLLDKTLIGILVPGTVSILGNDGVEVIKKMADIENGYYGQSEQIVKIALTIISSLGTVMIPRNTTLISQGCIDEFRENVSDAFRFVFLIGTPIMLGLAAIAFNFSPWFFGGGYEKVPYLIIFLSPLILIIGLSNVLGIQVLLPLKKDKEYIISICCGAVINLIANILLIPILYSYGAVIATIVAEAVVTIMMLIFARKQNITFSKILLESWRCFVSGLIMFCFVLVLQMFLKPKPIDTFILIIEGIVIYFSFLSIFREPFISRFSSYFNFKRKNSNL